MFIRVFTRFIQKTADVLGLRRVLHISYEKAVAFRRQSWIWLHMKRMRKWMEGGKINHGCGLKARPKRVIVSLTSFPERVQNEEVLGLCLYSLFTQTFRADKITLWLVEEEFKGKNEKLPEYLLKYEAMGLSIRWTENQKAYNKLMPALSFFPDDLIVTADDDVFYGRKWLENLYDAWLEYPDMIIAHRMRRVNATSTNVGNYLTWPLTPEAEPSVLNFFTGVGGVLYPPGVLGSKVFDRDLREAITPRNDDIWFWGMSVLNGRKSCAAKNACPNPYDLVPDKEGQQHLFSDNASRNDHSISRLFQHFPEIRNKVISALYASGQLDMAERIYPELSYMTKESFLLYLRSLFAYEYALDFIKAGSTILEIGYGEGYGVRHMATKMADARFFALDLFKELENDKTENKDLNNCRFMTYDGSHVPFENSYFDLIVSFQVVEHVEDVPNFLNEIKRLLKPGGQALLSTPNRIYRLCDGQRPVNRFHLREYSKEQFEAELEPIFRNVIVSGITSSPNVIRAEHRRVRNGRKDYSFCNRISDASHQKIIRPLTSIFQSRKAYFKRYSTKDFFISDKHPHEALDLLAIVSND